MDHFGTDVAAAVHDWWSTTFVDVVRAKYPQSTLAVVVLRPDAVHDWRQPAAPGTVLLDLRHGEADTDLLVRNIEHKLHFTLRTGLDSMHARRNPGLIEPGDFPHGGAVSHRGIFGGVSGLVEESDVFVVQQVIDQVLAVRADAARAAVAASLSGADGWAYLPNEPPPA